CVHFCLPAPLVVSLDLRALRRDSALAQSRPPIREPASSGILRLQLNAQRPQRRDGAGSDVERSSARRQGTAPSGGPPARSAPPGRPHTVAPQLAILRTRIVHVTSSSNEKRRQGRR